MVIEDVGDYVTFSKVGNIGNYVASVYVESGSSKIVRYLTVHLHTISDILKLLATCLQKPL